MTEPEHNIRQVADSSSSALLVLSNDGRIETMNQAALDLARDPVDSSRDRRADQTVEARYLWLASVVEALMGNSAEVVFNKQIITNDGVRLFDVRLSRLVDPKGKPRAVAAMLTAAEGGHMPAERPISAKPISHLSLFDEKTGLYNRRGFSILATHLLKLADRMKRDIAFLVCTVEDTAQTEGAGDDEIARVTADILIETFRASDAIARVGKREFAILAVGSFDEGVAELVARLHSVVASRNARGEYPHGLSVDTGVMPYDPEYARDVEELLARIPGSV